MCLILVIGGEGWDLKTSEERAFEREGERAATIGKPFGGDTGILKRQKPRVENVAPVPFDRLARNTPNPFSVVSTVVGVCGF